MSTRPLSPLLWARSLLFLFLFGSILCLFHLVHLVTLRLGARVYNHGFTLMNWCILWALRVGGVRFVTAPLPELPSGQPLILIANHQSMFDIPLIIWTLRHHQPRFVSKRELARGIPSISLTLRKGGHVLIDRKDATQAAAAIRSFGEEITRLRIAGCIFPEGTRARDGTMRRFKPGGALTLMESAPTAQVVPIAITNSWRIVRFNFLPIPAPTVTIRVLPPRTGVASREFLQDVEGEIRRAGAS